MTISEATRFIEKAFNIFNKKYFKNELPRVAITIQHSPKAYGHFVTSEIWDIENGNFFEINLGAETLNRPIASTMGTLIHEMTHLYCHINGIKDTSRRGQYHNKRFKQEAEKRGIEISFDKRIGWSVTNPSKELEEYCANKFGIEKLDVVRRDMFGEDGRETKKTTRYKYTCPCCEMSFTSPKVLNLICGACFQENERIEMLSVVC